MVGLIVVAAVALLLVIAAVLAVRWWTWKPVERHRVLVQVIDGPSIAGLVTSRRGPLLVLEDVTVHMPGSNPAQADGTTVIERSRVLWLQVVS